MLEQISTYQANTTNPTTLGLLQLWNGQAGLKIKVKFTDADLTDKYQIEFVDPKKTETSIDTKNIISTIDFSPVLNWLKTLEVQIDQGSNNEIQALKIPQVPADNSTTFKGQDWTKVEQVLETFGLKIEYSNNIKGENAAWGSIGNVNRYDPTNPSFQIRFTTDGLKSINVKLKWNLDTDLLDGAIVNESAPTIINIKAPLLVQVAQNLLDEFKATARFAGDTKNLNVDNVTNADDELVNKIILANLANDSRYQELLDQDLLEIQYVMQQNRPGNKDSNWKNLNDFKSFLRDQSNDQSSNQIWYRLQLKPTANFNLEAQANEAKILNAHETPGANIKIKYYINAANWETEADKVVVSGPSDALKWNLQTIFNGKITETNQNVYLSNAAGQALQIYFTTNPGATYDIPAGFGNSLDELQTKWIPIKPSQIRAGETNLKIKLVPMNGFVYGPAEANPKQAREHNVQINVQNVLYVDRNWFDQLLVLNEIEISALKETDFNQWENQIYEEIKKANKLDDLAIAKNVKIKYFFKNKKFNNFQDLLDEIELQRTSYENETTLGIVQLWNKTSALGDKIEALFTIDPTDQANYVLKTFTNDKPTEADLKGVIDTSKVYTSISLVDYINFIQNTKTTVEPNNNGSAGEITSFTLPQLSGNLATTFLANRSFEQIMQRLKQLGVQAKFATKANAPSNQWVDKDQVTSYDIQTSILFLSFEIDSTAANTKIQWSKTDRLNAGETLRANPVRLPLDVPKYIIIKPNADFWANIKKDFNFKGNTKFIDFDLNKINKFVQTILKTNATDSGDDSYNDAPLKIEFQVGQTAFTEIKELKDYLKGLTDDLTDRTIRFKFSIPESETEKWKLVDPNTEYTLLVETNDEIKKLKIYINDKGIFADLKNTKLSGTSQDLKWEFINDLKVDDTTGVLSGINRGKGLKVEFTFNADVADNAQTGQDVDVEWVNKMPKSFKVDQKQIFLRLALVDDSLYEYEKQNQRITLSLEEIIVILNLQNDWLKKLILSGNTKDLKIDDEQVQKQLQGVLPADQSNLVTIKYTIDGQTWYEKSAFQAFLERQKGQKDANNFILKRGEIKARFELNETTKAGKYQLVIDGEKINPDNSNNPGIQLINDQNQLNQDVRGYIELKHLKHFVAENFAIQGTNTKPQLIINKKQELETLMQNYATDDLFDILITSVRKTDGSWDFTKEISLLKIGNKFIDNTELINRGFVLGADKQVALRFKAKDTKYDVYNNDTKHPAGYDLDISKNVQITFEIENPFTKNNKTLALWWTVDHDTKVGKYYQGEGGFKIVNGLKDGTADVSDFMAAQAWIQGSQSGLSDKEKEVLELVYYIYDGEPDQTTIDKVKSEITDYQNSQWKKVNDVLDTDNFTQSLQLKVGQYVSVALRVKEKYATGDDVYTLKDADYSFVSPISSDGKTPGRAHGYKVKTADVNVDESKIILENILNSEQPPLDGYTNIKNLSLTKDEKENYKGVDLELQLFHQFYKGQNQQEVIITPFDKIKIIKRQQDNNTQTNGYFKDADGNEILDENSNKIPILLDENGRPTAPDEANSVTFSHKFTNYTEGFFGLNVPQDITQRNQWGIFKNQSVKIVFNAYEGKGGAKDPDFILDNTKTVDLKDKISPQIKFPLFNQEDIKYSFNHEDFVKDQIKYENATDPENGPLDGRSKVATLIKLKKTTNKNATETIIQGNDANDAVTKLNAELNDSFNGKLGFETTYERTTGGIEVQQSLNLYNISTLSNNDRIKVRIVSTDSDFIWAEPPKPLTINVSGLTALAPKRDKLQFLRVEQSGRINGQGAFKVLINNPKDPNSDPKEILNGWKFVLRVWNENKEIKTGWTDDQNQITNLKNGDKIEWKLLDESGNPVSDAYYNTVAGQHELNSDGTTKFVFNEMQYTNGKNSGEVVTEGIGKYPINSEEYPENSGFVIADLQDALEVFEISDTAFAKVMAQLEPHYVGFNGQGTINFKEDYLSKNYYVNSLGELYEKPFDQPTFKQQADDSVVEISLADFLANTTFYTSDPNLINYQNGFKFLGNDTNLNNHLSNGDQVWAQFDLRADNNEVNRGISTELNPVTGLQELLTDPMTPLWYILMAIGGVVTLGGLSLLFLWIKRNRKLKR